MKKFFIISLFLLLFGILNANDLSYQIPQVLVIQSYHSGFLWADNIDSGIKATLKNYDSNIRIKTEFLDTKRFNTEEFKDNLKMMLEYKYKDSKFDVIIVADNNAFEIVKELHDTVFKGAPVVFCGVNYFHPSQLGSMKNVTGVREKIVSLENFQLIKKIHKNVKKIIVLNEETPTGKQNRINIMADIREFKEDVEIEIVEDISIRDLKTLLSSLSPDTVVLYSIFFKDNLGNFLEYDESILLVTDYSSVPVYVSIDFSLGYGAVGGFLTSGTLQGESAAKLAIEILKGADAEKLDIIDVSPNTYYFDYHAMQKWGIKLSDLPENSKIINYEESYFTRNKKLIFRFSLIVLILSGIIFWLILTLIKKNKLKNDLLKTNESLTNLKENLEVIVKDRTNDLEDERNFISTVQDYEDSLVIVFDENGVINRANRCALLNLEFDLDTIKGQSLWQVFEHEDDILTIRRYIDSNDISQGNLTLQLRLISNKGKNIIADSVITTITAKGIKYFILTATNVTEKYYLFEKLEREEKKYRSVYENSGIAMVTYASNDYVVMMNNKFEELTGYSREEAVNKMTWKDFVDKSSVDLIQTNKDLRSQMKLAPTDNYEIKLVHKKGYVIDVLISVVMVAETNEIISSITDITAKNAIQNKMKLLLEEQKAFNQAKNVFYKNFGIDLKSPLNSLHGIIDLIRNTTDSSKKNIYLNILQDLSCQMLYIVTEMTTFQLDNSKNDLIIQKCNLSEFITYTTEILIIRSNIAEIYFNIDESLNSIQYLAIDKLEKLIQILIIKLSRDNPMIPIIIDIATERDDYIKFTLRKQKDLPQDKKYLKIEGEKKGNIHKLEYISDFKFNHLIVNQLVSQLKGEIDYLRSSSNDNIYVFKIKRFSPEDMSVDINDFESDNNIHRYILPNDVSEYTQKSISNLYSLKVLIVNYSSISHFVLYKILELLNQKIEVCTAEQDFKELINKTTYDIVFLDLSVVSINNLSTLKEIRELTNIYQPFVVSSKLLNQSDLDLEERDGFNDLINTEFPELLSISNIALIIEAATEYKNSNI